MKDLHRKLISLMDSIHKVAVKNNLIYSLEAGSALGAVRHEGIIPGDEDIDIVAPFEQYDEFVKTMKNELSYEVINGLEVNSKKNRSIFTRIYDGDDHIDVVPFCFTKQETSRGLVFVHELRGFRNGKPRPETKRFEIIGFTILSGILHIIPDIVLRKSIKKQMKMIYENEGNNYFPFGTDKLFKTNRKFVEKLTTVKLYKFNDKEFYLGTNPHELLVGGYGKDYMTPKRSNYYREQKLN